MHLVSFQGVRSTLGGAVWFDRLFKAPIAVHVPSLLQHLGARSVLGIFAHPDDETLAAGVLADAGRRDGMDVWTITLTRGESGYLPPHIARREDLSLIRESELRRYGYALGVDHQELWDYPDGGLHTVPPYDIVDRIVTHMSRLHRARPGVSPIFS